MIPIKHIQEWSHFAPWQDNYQIEQDLVISRVLVEIFADPFLKERLAFRGGTALHKLFLKEPARYSEDIDLVQITGGPIGEILDRLRMVLSWFEKVNVERSEITSTMIFRYESEAEPKVKRKLKVEINAREHFALLGYNKIFFEVKSEWFTGATEIPSFYIEEMLSTKLRALFQRRKGRDLFDLYCALTENEIDSAKVIAGFHEYLKRGDNTITAANFMQNLDEKVVDANFLGDIEALIRPDVKYESQKAYELVKAELIEKI
ncbi:MAG TPA: nucleotidyl transferase AbiEii/AbiGii toxin family protein [Cyclobacteriaceae bacterium]|nr:nucleotidyl transferase AbiEii/AbiGii toxin family protein [Cyclobacteriaceae bacterium]